MRDRDPLTRLRDVRGFVFDMDGTLVLGDRHNHGLRPLPGAVEITGWAAGRGLPFVVFTNGTTRTPARRAAQLVISTAPGSGRRPWFCRSPSTSVPSLSNTKPRTSLSRASGSRSRTAALLELEPEPGLFHHEPAGRRPGAQLAQQP